MTVWTLASSDKHGALRLGQAFGEVVEAFGQASHVHGRSVLKYGDVELHFWDDTLWLVHCEFGGPPLPQAVASEVLRLRPDDLAWPTSHLVLKQLVEGRGFSTEQFVEPWGEGFKFGLGRLVIHEDDQLVSWSVTRPA